jgi:hypothetical protein
MLRWIAGWAARYAPTVEQQAEKALPELRLELGAINFEVQQPTSCKVLHKWEPTTRT